MHAVAYNHVEPRLLATANAREGIGLWDIRKPRRYTILEKMCNIRLPKSQMLPIILNMS